MKKMKKILVGILLATLLLNAYSMTILAVEHEIMPCYEESSNVNVYLQIKKKTAFCGFSYNGESGVSKIEGTLKLYDETSKKTVKTWDISVEKSYYSTSKNVTVKKGHTYTLSFSGKAYDKDGKSEKISGSTTKEN